MSILEKQVSVKLHPKNINYYESKKYEIPRYIDNSGRLRVKRGTSIFVNVEDALSSAKITKVCDECGKNTGMLLFNYHETKANNDGIDRCDKCSSIYIGKTKIDNVTYDRSLEYWAIRNDKVHLLEEFSNNNKKKPDNISFGSDELYLWNCPTFGSIHEYSMPASRRTIDESSCPYCSGHRVHDTNCLATTHSNLIKEWNHTLNGSITPYNKSHGSLTKVWWNCVNGHEPYFQQISCKVRGYGCPKCSESKGEIKIRKWLKQFNIDCCSQKKFDRLVGIGGSSLSYDFFLPENNLLIEYQGQFHDGTVTFQTEQDLKKQQEHDSRKREYAHRNNICLLEIWYWDFNNIDTILSKILADNGVHQGEVRRGE